MMKKILIGMILCLYIISVLAQKGILSSTVRIPDMRPPPARTIYEDTQFVEAARMAHMNIAKNHGTEMERFLCFTNIGSNTYTNTSACTILFSGRTKINNDGF